MVKNPEIYTVSAALRKPEHPDALSVEIVVRVRACGLVDALAKVHAAAPELVLEDARVRTISCSAGRNAVLAAAREVRSRIVACAGCGVGFHRDDLVDGLCDDCRDAIPTS